MMGILWFEKQHKESGQTLVALLAFISTAILLTTAATAITLVNAQATTTLGIGETALRIAEDGVENALLRLLRDPTYTGETLTTADGNATITVSGSSTKTITAVGTSGTKRRTVTAVVNYANNTFTLSSWSESP